MTFWSLPWMAACLLALATGPLSPLVVSKRYAFMAPSISHGAFFGASLSLAIFGESPDSLLPFFTTLLVTTILSLLLAYGMRHRSTPSDAAMGIFLSVSMALGILIQELFVEGSGHLFSYLFGNILLLTPLDLFLLALLLGITLLALYPCRRAWALYVIDGEAAKVRGVPVWAFHYGLTVLLTVLIVLGVKVAGAILINSFLLTPGLFALALASSFKRVFFLSVLFSLATTVLGFMMAIALDLPVGPALVLVQFLCLVTPFVFKKGLGLGIVFLFFILPSLAESTNDTPSPKFKLYQLDHIHKGCPTNSQCSPELGRRRQEWIDLLKKSSSWKKLNQFCRQKGIPLEVWSFSRQEKQGPISWDSPCPLHAKNNILIALAFAKTMKELEQREKSGQIYLSRAFLVGSKGHRTYKILRGATPLYLHGEDLVYTKESEGFYYGLQLGPMGEMKIVPPKVPKHSSQFVSCPPSLQKHFMAHPHPDGLYQSSYCLSLWNQKTKRYQTMIFGWSCDL